MSEHTPAPWKAERRNWRGEPAEHKIYISGNEYQSYDCSDEDDDESGIVTVATGVCIVEGNATSQKTTEANAKLIAAAPALLAACKAQHDAIDCLMAWLIVADKDFRPTKSGIWPAVLQGNEAIKQAES